MTDFIHEHPKDEQIPAPAGPTPPPAEPELDEKTGQKRVYGYIFLLFIVAFSLLLWAFLMNQRSTDQVLSELRGSASTLQSTLDRNIELEEQLGESERQKLLLEKQVERLEEQNRQLRQTVDEEQERSDRLLGDLAAYAQAANLEYAFGQKDYERCRELIERSLWAAYESGESPFSEDDREDIRPMTRARFEEILEAVDYEKPTENP